MHEYEEKEVLESLANVLSQLELPPKRRFESISDAEAEFLHSLVRDNSAVDTLEVGLAFGVSAAAIMATHECKHVSVDPYQESRYASLGLQNIERIGFANRLNFIAAHSHTALPRLSSESREFDLAFVDGGHRFDQVFVDFYFVDLTLRLGGLVVFHDAWMRSTQLVASFIDSNRTDYSREVCPGNLVTFRKIGVDSRAWNHFEEFYTDKGIESHTEISAHMASNGQEACLGQDDAGCAGIRLISRRCGN